MEERIKFKTHLTFLSLCPKWLRWIQLRV
jgi:hypothetical protein